jgi:hypothetical protein
MTATSVTGIGQGSAVGNQPARKAFQYQIVATGTAITNGLGSVDIDVEDWEINVNSGAIRYFCTAKGTGSETVNYVDFSFGTRSGLVSSFIGKVSFAGNPNTNFDWMIVQTKTK